MMQPGDRGIDVSAYQHPNGAVINYAAVAKAGYKFAYVELTQGTYLTNPYSVADARGFQSVGMETGAYLFYSPNDSQDEQTSDFTKLYQAIGGWTLPIMLDVETPSAQGWAMLGKLIGDQRSNLKGSTGAEVGAYLNLDFYDNLPGCPWGWDIWLADPSHPSAPSKPCLLQQSGQGPVPGITGAVDLDIWRAGTAPVPISPGEEEDMPLYATLNGTGYVVAADLSSKKGVPDGTDAQALLATGLYKEVTLDAALLNAIPGT